MQTTKMATMKRCLGVLALALTAAGSVRADTFAYVLTQGGQFGTIDLDTGVFTQVRAIGRSFKGLGVAGGYLYTSEGSVLWELNPANGNLRKVGGLTYLGSSYSGALGSGEGGSLILLHDQDVFYVDRSTGTLTKDIYNSAPPSGSISACSTNGEYTPGNRLAVYYTVGDLVYVPAVNGVDGDPPIGNLGFRATALMGAEPNIANGLYAVSSAAPYPIYIFDIITKVTTFVANPSGNPPPMSAFAGLAPSVSPSITPAHPEFAPQNVGTASQPMTVRLANHGFTAMTISDIRTSGDFAQTNLCGLDLEPNTSCTISVTFTPTQKGNRTGTLTVREGAGGSPHTTNLFGTGE